MTIAAIALFRRASAVFFGLWSGVAAACELQSEAVTIISQNETTIALGDGRLVVLADLRAMGGIEHTRPGPATLHFGDRTDRYGRVIGDVWVGSGDTPSSLSHSLLRSGLALVDPAVMPMTCLEAAFDAERGAEAARRGIWREPPVVGALEARLDAEAGQYRLVEGRVLSIGETRRTIYLNFGRDYRTDFTVLVSKADARGWEAELLALEGQDVRIRGVIEAWNGAMIRVEHPGQIERR